jgi:hypothetical protein
MTDISLRLALAECEIAYGNNEISDATALALAAACRSQAAVVLDFVATGAVPAETAPLYREVEGSSTLGPVALSMLGTYLMAHAGRGPVPGWGTA